MNHASRKFILTLRPFDIQRMISCHAGCRDNLMKANTNAEIRTHHQLNFNLC